eukprot:Gb_16418 [translate_table: standard]
MAASISYAVIHFERNPISGLIHTCSYKSTAFLGTLSSSRRRFSGLTDDKCAPRTRTKSALSEESPMSIEFAEPQRWGRGGGLFHNFADIDPTATIETGAIVHAHAKLGPDVHVGSGSVVGPLVTVGSSTRIGLFPFCNHACSGATICTVDLSESTLAIDRRSHLSCNYLMHCCSFLQHDNNV